MQQPRQPSQKIISLDQVPNELSSVDYVGDQVQEASVSEASDQIMRFPPFYVDADVDILDPTFPRLPQMQITSTNQQLPQMKVQQNPPKFRPKLHLLKNLPQETYKQKSSKNSCTCAIF